MKTKTSSKNPLRGLLDAGQSFWMDTISREMIQDGTLKRMIKEDGLRGVTSNPDIFQKAISGSALYDPQIKKLAQAGKSANEIYEALAVDDIQKAADILRPVYDASDGVDGFISLEVSPYLAFDEAGTVEEAHRLWAAVNRPNVFIKVPATPPGIRAIHGLIADGINVNVTLIFSLDAYDDVMEAYIAGLEDRMKAGNPIDRVRSVASFFVSRIDVLVDKLLGTRITAATPRTGALSLKDAVAGKGVPVSGEEDAPQQLLGSIAVAAAKVAYRNFKDRFNSPRFAKLAEAGAKVQRPLWASTSSKNALYPETVYVAPLIGPDTVNTMPMATINSWRKAGQVRPNSIEDGLAEAEQTLETLKEFGVDIIGATWQIMEEGVAKFNQPFDKLMTSISQKRAEVIGFAPAKESIGNFAKDVTAVAESLSEAQYLARLWRKDVSLWPGNADARAAIANRLGWLYSPQYMQSAVDTMTSFASEVRKSGIKHIVLLGMGGSSLCPEVCARTFGSRAGFPEMVVLDTTSPDAIRSAEKRIDITKALFIPASKSGSTIETNSLFHYFRERLTEAGVMNPGEHFIGITDPDTSLEAMAAEHGFRRTFINPPDIGGRFSALSFFGLVPMALIGIDVGKLLERAALFTLDGESLVPVAADPGARLGVILAVLGKKGRNKVTLLTSPGLRSFGIWIEQLVAESTGKDGVGLLPVDGEALSKPTAYGNDRVFVSIELAGDKVDAKKLAAVEAAGHPLIRIPVRDVIDLGAEFMRWEIATATAGVLLKINPFDEPNVSESKRNTAELLAEFKQKKKLPLPKESFAAGGISVTLSKAARAAAGKATGVGSLKAILSSLLSSVGSDDYIGLLAFVEQSSGNAARLGALRTGLRDATHAAVTVGFGPRYLHSTGQLHKGGANNGVFIMITSEPAADVSIPGQDYTFGTLMRAQALGDFRALNEHGRRAVLIHIGRDVEGGIKKIATAAGVK